MFFRCPSSVLHSVGIFLSRVLTGLRLQEHPPMGQSSFPFSPGLSDRISPVPNITPKANVLITMTNWQRNHRTFLGHEAPCWLPGAGLQLLFWQWGERAIDGRLTCPHCDGHVS